MAGAASQAGSGVIRPSTTTNSYPAPPGGIGTFNARLGRSCGGACAGSGARTKWRVLEPHRRGDFGTLAVRKRHHRRMHSLGAPIVTFDEFDAARPEGRIVATSGGYDPVHPGHISSIQESATYGDLVVVIVNGDAFLEAKKGQAFQDLQTRCLIVSALRGVDYVVPFEIEGDGTVIEALRRLRPHVFTKGGDRVDERNIPEWVICQELGTELISGVGEDKRWSSSWFLDAWAKGRAQT